MLRRTALAIAFTSLAVFAQSERPTASAFDVATIRLNQNDGRENGIETVPGRVTLRNASLLTCIRWAYDVQEFQVSGPPWLSELRFDVNAKAATPVEEAELRKMMQVLLTERFKLAAHREDKEISALVMTVAKGGHKLKQVEQEGSPSFQTGKLNLTGTGATLSQLTEFLTKQTRTPIIDQTGLTGRFNYFLDINAYVTDEIMKSAVNGPPPDAPSIIAQAMQSQLGLRLDAKKAAVNMVIVDHMEKIPAEN